MLFNGLHDRHKPDACELAPRNYIYALSLWYLVGFIHMYIDQHAMHDVQRKAPSEMNGPEAEEDRCALDSMLCWQWLIPDLSQQLDQLSCHGVLPPRMPNYRAVCVMAVDNVVCRLACLLRALYPVATIGHWRHGTLALPGDFRPVMSARAGPSLVTKRTQACRKKLSLLCAHGQVLPTLLPRVTGSCRGRGVFSGPVW